MAMYRCSLTTLLLAIQLFNLSIVSTQAYKGTISNTNIQLDELSAQQYQMDLLTDRQTYTLNDRPP